MSKIAKNELEQILTELGLSDHEASVYLASLRLGPAKVADISHLAQIKRTTGYPVVRSLIEKGLMRVESRGIKRMFAAESPDRLKTLLEIRWTKFENLMPKFSALQNLKSSESFLKYYEGVPGIKSVYEDLLLTVPLHSDYFVISNLADLLALDEKYFRNFFERRAKKSLNIKIIAQDSPEARHYQKFQKNFNEQVKILPASRKIATNLVLTSQKVVIHQLAPPVLAIVIENQSVVQMHREMFEIIWQSLAE